MEELLMEDDAAQGLHLQNWIFLYFQGNKLYLDGIENNRGSYIILF